MPVVASTPEPPHRTVTLILKWLRKLLCKIIAAILAAMNPFSVLKTAS
jgi:hypothetical protein